MKTETVKCPECGAAALYETTIKGGGHEGPNLLPGLGKRIFGGLLRDWAKFRVVVCENCGLTRFYADDESRTNLPKASQWHRI